MDSTIKSERMLKLNSTVVNRKGNLVVYWMERDIRVGDNWALIAANQLAESLKARLEVIYIYDPFVYGNYERRIDFVRESIKSVRDSLNEINISLKVYSGNSIEVMEDYISKNEISAMISDFNPLRAIRDAKKNIAVMAEFPFYCVDAHNIVPAWVTSNKEEIGARTIRNKTNNLLPEFLTEFPELKKRNQMVEIITDEQIDNVFNKIKIDRSAPAIDWIIPGESAAHQTFNDFIQHKIDRYSEQRNNPNMNAISNMSPYLHFGNISAQRMALMLIGNSNENCKSYLEEMIIRRELSENYVYYNPNYDNFKGFPNWAKKTLDDHRIDRREYIYSLEQFEKGETHEELWNAAQRELMNTGKLHGYMRMYWAKKILEWSKSPEEAQAFAIYLNDKYAIDGVDPNGYTGIAWSVGGVHDRAWTERPIFGKIRYMNYNGCKRKFDVEKYIAKQFNMELKYE